MVTHSCNLEWRQKDQEFKTSVSYVKPCLQTNVRPTNEQIDTWYRVFSLYVQYAG